MTLPDFLVEWPDNEIMLRGHRISLYHVISRHQEGMGVDALHEWYPTLERGLIHKVLDFYHANRAEIDDYVEKERQEFARQAAAHPPMDVDALRRRAGERERLAGG